MNNASRLIKFKRLEDNNLPLPKKSTEFSAGIDLSACLTRSSIQNDCVIKDGVLTYIIEGNKTAMIPLGFCCDFSSNNQDLVLKLFVRSSIGRVGLVLANGTGIIDSDYRGELIACIRNVTNSPIEITHGARIVQAILEEYINCGIVEVDCLDNTVRGEGGFGSSGIS